MTSFPHLLLFDLSSDSHLPGYLRHLIHYWIHNNLNGQLTILVWPGFLRAHEDVVELAEKASQGNIRFMTLTKEEARQKQALDGEHAKAKTTLAALLKDGEASDYALGNDWELLCAYARRLAVDHALILRIDSFLPLLAAGYSAPVPISGIYFGPIFYYTKTESFMAEKFTLSRALRHPALHTLFFLDQLVLPALEQFSGKEKAVYLPDPAEEMQPHPNAVALLHEELGVGEGRKVCMLFGHQTRRKGVEAVFSALRQMEEVSLQKICLLLVGSIDAAYRERIQGQIDDLRANTAVQLITRFQFVPESDVPAYFQLADVILCPYLGHAGSSGVLLLAAAAGKPVISSEYGWMGEMVRRHELGLTVNSENMHEIGNSIQNFLDQEPQDFINSELAAAWIGGHQPEKYASTIFNHFGLTAASPLSK